MKTHSHIVAGPAPLVFIEGCPSVQFGPEAIGLPVVESVFDCGVQGPWGRVQVQLQMLTQCAERAKYSSAGGR